MKVLYFDCFSGVAGDMVLGALLDLGVDFEAWRRALLTLPVRGFRVERSRVMKGPIACTHVDVVVDETGTEARDHRHLVDVVRLVQAADLPGAVKARAEAVFRRLAGAEARIHDATPDTVRFHEVGAVDAIVDIVGACLALHDLGIEAVYASPVTVGRTRVDTAHGWLPTPAPATLELLKGIPVHWCDQEAELATPTGAALMTSLAEKFGSPPDGKILGVGYGAGDHDFTGLPNALRAILMDRVSPPAADRVVVLEANLDDMSPEHVGAVVPRLLDAGALDVFTTSVTMKKGRPGLRLTVLASPPHREKLTTCILRETSTFGVRFQEMERVVLDRRHVEVDTAWGGVRIKVGLLGDEEVQAAPEHEDCMRLAGSAGVPVTMVYDAALAAYHARKR